MNVITGVGTNDPPVAHFLEHDTIAFQVVDTLSGGSTRGEWDGPMPGVVRPLLQWTNTFQPRPLAEAGSSADWPHVGEAGRE